MRHKLLGATSFGNSSGRHRLLYLNVRVEQPKSFTGLFIRAISERTRRQSGLDDVGVVPEPGEFIDQFANCGGVLQNIGRKWCQARQMTPLLRAVLTWITLCKLIGPSVCSLEERLRPKEASVERLAETQSKTGRRSKRHPMT